MKRLIFIISVIFISFQFTAQTNHSSEINSSKKVEASELKEKDFIHFQVSTKKKIMTSEHSNKSIDPKVKSKNKTILKPKQ